MQMPCLPHPCSRDTPNTRNTDGSSAYQQAHVRLDRRDQAPARGRHGSSYGPSRAARAPRRAPRPPHDAGGAAGERWDNPARRAPPWPGPSRALLPRRAPAGPARSLRPTAIARGERQMVDVERGNRRVDGPANRSPCGMRPSSIRLRTGTSHATWCSCGKYPMARARACGDSATSGSPASDTFPSSASSNPASISSRLDLPAPFGPQIAVIVPGSNVAVTSATRPASERFSAFSVMPAPAACGSATTGRRARRAG